MAENRGSIGFSTTYRPPVPLEIFSCTLPPTSNEDELPMTDGVNYNYNGQEISLAALKTILKRKELSSKVQEADVDSGRLSGMVFVSERRGLELLHIALHFNDKKYPPKVFCLADVFGKVNFSGVRMEDSGCIAGDYLVYVTTKDAAPKRQPWTAVYKTNLETGKTDRLTQSGEADLSPSVAPSGKMIAVASFQGKPGGWDGKIEDLQTDIFVMFVEKPFYRCKVVSNGGWPTWGSDNVIFFHRKEGEFWGVFRADVSKVIESLVTLDRIQAATMPAIDATTVKVSRVTPVRIQAMTPAAINATTVAVATIRQKSEFSDVRVEAQYRHIEIFYSDGHQRTIRITQNIMPKADHFNPFVIDCGKRIGYHRCKSGLLKSGDDISRYSHKLESPHPDVGLFRVPGIFPTFSKDGSKLAFVDNEFKALWVADSKGLRIVYQAKGPDNIFSPVWNQNSENDIVYVSMGPSFQSDKTLNIYAIPNVSNGAQELVQLTRASNNAFPSTNSDGTKLVFRSTRDGGDERYKNLYIMEDAKLGEYEGGEITRLTNGHWIDTHCQWSPTEDWIAFSSTRHKPKGVDVPKSDNGLDPGYFAVFLVNVKYPSTVVRVMASGRDVSGHVNHPFFSPDGKSIVVTADLAAVSVDPISLPLFLHSVRPYGDIFTFDIDRTDIEKNVNVKEFNRITHSRYENSTAAWTKFSTQDSKAAWNKLLNEGITPSCPYVHHNGGESWHMTGHLCIPKRCC